MAANARLRNSLSSERLTTRRPNVFRALGRDDPPPSIDIDGRPYFWDTTLKHDSWAATAVYLDADGRRVACKCFRVAPIAFVPGAWIGRFFARREDRVLQLVRGRAGFPRAVGPVWAGGKRLHHAVAHEWIDGHTFTPWSAVDDEFFPRLREIIAVLHALDIAYVDMPKWENILVGEDRRPYLLDYQIYLRAQGWPWRAFVRLFQGADLYYLRRHWMRARPDQWSESDRAAATRQPLVVRLGEGMGVWLRPIRVGILRLFGVRGDPRHDALHYDRPRRL